MFAQFFKYNIVGIVNTLVGFSIIFLLMFAGVTPTVSNAIGYGLGAILSYFLNKKYTFNAENNSQTQMLKFFMVLGVAYMLNYVVLQWLLSVMNPYGAQVLSAIVYTVSSFILAKFFVFEA